MAWKGSEQKEQAWWMRGGSPVWVPSEFSGDKMTRKLRNVSWKKRAASRRENRKWRRKTVFVHGCRAPSVVSHSWSRRPGWAGGDGDWVAHIFPLPSPRGPRAGGGGGGRGAGRCLDLTKRSCGLFHLFNTWQGRKRCTHLPLFLYDSLKLYSGFKLFWNSWSPKSKLSTIQTLRHLFLPPAKRKSEVGGLQIWAFFSQLSTFTLYIFKHKYLNLNGFKTDSLL